MTTEANSLIETGEATAMLPVANGKTKPITVIGTAAIRATFDDATLQQAVNARLAPGVDEVVLNPDAHIGYGAPIGCVMTSGSHIYPGPVGVDIKCSMSLLQLELPADQIEDRKTRRAIIDAICERTPTGAGRGQRSVPKSRHVSEPLGRRVAIEGASPQVCDAIGIPARWAQRCEDSFHLGHDDTRDALSARLDWLLHNGEFPKFGEKITQLGSYGGGNHFGECEVVTVGDDSRAEFCARVFGLRDNHVAFLSHCGSRGFGHNLAMGQFKALQSKFDTWGIKYPGADKHLCYAPLGTPEADAYLNDMAMGANFATVNHLLINALVLEAFQEVLPGVTGELVYLISHNIARKEVVSNKLAWVMRKGATRAFPGGHHALKGTPFEKSGHPILLPGDPQRGSAVMVADKGAELSCYSVNHGAGRVLGRKQAIRTLDQKTVNESFEERDILTNCRNYPRDEAPDAYKDFDEVLRSVKVAGLASEVARLKAKFVIKDASEADD
jgi:tRNA-splicing ligase RtcB (3'-phosphate/5'-hydroxy nucleic acid ligase)